MNQCPHCNIKFGNRGYFGHAKHCPKSPEIADRLRQFLRDNATDGEIMTVTEYQESYKPNGLPSFHMMYKVFGTWHGLAKWAGLEASKYRLTGDSPERNEHVRTVMADDAIHDFGFPVIPVQHKVRAWNWRRKTYVVVGTQENYRVK